MKNPFSCLQIVLPLPALLLAGATACAVTFTNDTVISSFNTNYDGLDLALTNCTLTVDGPHAFASLQVLNGGTLTHTVAPGGTVNQWRAVTNEPQVLSVTNVATLSNANVQVSSIVVQDLSGLVIYTNGADYVTGLDTNGMTTLLLTTNTAIAEGSTNLVSYAYLVPVSGGLSLTVTGDVTVAQGGAINTDGKGYGGGAGFGQGNSFGSPACGSGAGHGGLGGQSAASGGPGGGVSYDSIQQPAMMGSGGGAGFGGLGGIGGGSIKLVVGGTLRVDGVVSANGADALNDRAGGGSGGSIWLSAQSVAGTGLLSANGGVGEPTQGGGGGGGRISLWYNANSFLGTIAARGGNGYVRGGAGTIYTRVNGQPTGQVLVDNGGRAGATTSFFSGEPFALTAQSGAVIVLQGSVTFGNLVLNSNAWINLVNQTLTVTGDATIRAGAGIIADGAGSAAGAGSGAGRGVSASIGYIGGGAGYGGYGAMGGAPPSYTASGGSTYGSMFTPTDAGSGGGTYSPFAIGGTGGGAVRMTVSGMLLVDGRVSADGSAGLTEGGGGGSGGSVWLTAGTLAGAGVISANGGLGNGLGGGGGGGRIAVQYTMNLFFGTISARGAGGSAAGGAGTIYLKANGQSSGLVLVDNGGQAGTNTTWTQISPMDLTVKGGAVVTPPSSQTIGTLLVASNGWVSLSSQTLTVTGNATVQAGGGIIADRTGYAAGSGPGAGGYAYAGSGYIGGGGGYGGYGASGMPYSSYGANGGNIYGSVTAPTDMGSGGGSYYTSGIGGAGGGAVRLTVTGVLQVDGRISAAGGAGVSASAGGGSGGTISLNVGTLAGSGTIAANGGMGIYQGGGGAGGRIAIVYVAYDFSGLVSAYGGAGYVAGGAGTVFSRQSNQPTGLVMADNGGQSGTNTSWTGTGPFDLAVKGGAMVSPPNSQSFGTLLVASNGWLSIVNQPLTVTGNATVQAGGGILADGTGYAGGTGTGAGHYISPSGYGYIGSGGGYGGYGAAGGATPDYSSPAGGTTYGSVTTPTDLGSGGGGLSPYAPGGAGGGAILLTVSGTLQVDGRISARGNSASSPSAGGGSGGTISLTVGTLAGSGVISANGGAGNARGGGGGGGRVSVTYSSANTFSGLLSAYGGGGFAVGGAGTVYVRPLSGPSSLGPVIVDNGGQAGTNTSWPSVGSVDVTIRNGGWLAMPSGSQTVGNLLIGSNGWIYINGGAGLNGPTLSVRGNATLQAGGGIVADGGGYSYSNGGTGPGGGTYGVSGGGGGFGGCGGAGGGGGAGASAGMGGRSVGSVASGGPGSAGGTQNSTILGGAGGGAVSLNVTGTLQVDGRISSAGGAAISANTGGGSGGGIALTVGTLAGAGVIAANGGAGNGLGGGGGGGRITITYTANAFSGTMSAYGGGGYAGGGAGTIYTKASNKSWGQVLADNGGQAGTNTSWSSTSTIDLTATGGAVVSPQASQTFGNLLVTSNAWLSVSSQVLTVTSNATIQAGGGIIADGMGNGGNVGPGAGRSTYSSSVGNLGGGGGYGGYGASGGSNTLAYGGSAYGSVTGPVDFGSGGGAYSSSLPAGGGGGALRLNVTGALLINGRISANGGAAPGPGSGGGSGGSVWLTAGTLAGAGTVSADGGTGNGWGGGGGGGRVALQYGVSIFEGMISAAGGGGNGWGGAGTIYTKGNSQAMGQIVVDNGGHSGTNTPLAYLSPFDLTIRGAAVVYPADPYLMLSNLFVSSGGTLTALPTQTNLDVAVLRNASIDTGGVVAMDGKGFGLGLGPGAGLSANSIGSGAGYGGVGGASSLSAGGVTYGSAQQPVERGSGGGHGWQGVSGGGEGGGAIRLIVGGTLSVNGRLSAGGDAAVQDDGGGGSGGSLLLTAGALAGNGAIGADGGAGEFYDGGGGGGGRIAIYTPVNAFAGLVSAAGGAGKFPGQAGSIYSASTPLAPQVISVAPTGTLNYAVSSFDVLFGTIVNPASVSAATVALTAPGGLVVSNLTVNALSPYAFRVSFPQQTAQGDYAITVGPQILDLLGQPMSQVYTSVFSIVWTSVQGTVTDTNGLPVSGVVLQPDGGAPSAATDTNGFYLLSLPPTVTLHVTPSAPGLRFVPSSRAYTNLTTAVSNENYLAVSTVAPSVAMQVQTNSLMLSWYGISGVTYQPLYSTNLVDWLPYSGALPGTNGPLQLVVPIGTDPMEFFRVGASY